MDDMSKTEGMRAAREARDRAGASRGASQSAVEAAMGRYLSAEQYRQLAEDEPSPDERHEQVDRGE